MIYAELSLSNKAMIKAYEKGFKVDQEGVVTSSTGTVRKLRIDTRGYKVFNFGFESNKVVISVHRLQAYQKYKEALFVPGILVRHLDSNPLNNRSDNITIGSPSDNMMDKTQEERVKQAIISSTPNRVLIDEDIKELRRLRNEEGWSYLMLMDKYSVTSKGSMWEFLNRKYVTKK